MLLQLQQQQQWQAQSQFQTYESFGQIMADVPREPIYISIAIAVLPFILYVLWKKHVLRNLFIKPVVVLFYRTWYARKDNEIEDRLKEEYEGIAGSKIEIKDLLKYAGYAGMIGISALTLKKAFFFSVVVSGSMMPTLFQSDLVLVESLTKENIEVGDIVMFTDPSRGGMPIIHRVTSVDDLGKIKTAGDNSGPDPWTLRTGNIEGKVVTVNGRPVIIKNLGTYLVPRRITVAGSEPIYEGLSDIIQWVHANGPMILIVLLVILIAGNLEGKRKYKAMYE